MNRTSFRISLLFLIFATITLITLPSSGYAFKVGPGGEGQCSDCHSIDLKETKEILKELVSVIHGVDFSDVPGLYLVDATGKNGKRGMLYMDFSKSYVIAGNFINIADKTNVTKREMTRLRRVDLTTIPLTDSLVIGDPGAAKKVILFTDPQCPYCEKLHPELQKVVDADPGVVFFIKMMPLVSIHPDSLRIAKSVLCEGSVKLLEASFAGKKIPDPTCESDAVERTLKIAQEIGIGSTPTLLFPDGRIISGYRPAEEIIKLLNNP